MRKDEIKDFTDEQLIVNAIKTYTKLAVNLNLGMGIKILSRNTQDLFEEMKKRGILTQESIDYLNL